MKYLKYLTEDTVTKALALPEPEIGGDYATEKVERYIKMIEAALDSMTKKKENDANDAIVQDLRTKKKAWENVDQQTKPVKIKKDGEGEPPPEETPPPEEKEKEVVKESVIKHLTMLLS